MYKKTKNKKNLFIILIGITLLSGIGIFIYSSNNNSKNDNTYVADRTSTENKQNENPEQNQSNSDNPSTPENVPNNVEEKQNISQSSPPPAPIEEQIATFSTKIYNKEAARQNNINITCNTLNGTIVKNGETFSFCNTVRSSI